MSDSRSEKKPGAMPGAQTPKLELLSSEVEWKTCMKCGHSAMVVPSPTLACEQCGRIYAKMEEAWRKGA